MKKTQYKSTTIRLPKKVHKELKRKASRENKSVAQLMREAAEYILFVDKGMYPTKDMYEKLDNLSSKEKGTEKPVTQKFIKTLKKQ